MGALKLIKDAYSIYVQSPKRFKSSASTILWIVEIISKSLVSGIKTENCQNKEGLAQNKSSDYSETDYRG